MNPRHDLTPGAPLTPRQFVVARLVVGGQRNRDIAKALDISANTVKTQLRLVYRKLGVTTRTALAAALLTNPPTELRWNDTYIKWSADTDPAALEQLLDLFAGKPPSRAAVVAAAVALDPAQAPAQAPTQGGHHG